MSKVNPWRNPGGARRSWPAPFFSPSVGLSSSNPDMGDGEGRDEQGALGFTGLSSEQRCSQTVAHPPSLPTPVSTVYLKGPAVPPTL